MRESLQSCFKISIGFFYIRNDLAGLEKILVARRRLKIYCDARTHSYIVVDHVSVTSEPNMGKKSFFHQNIVLMTLKSWFNYKNIRAICCTFSVVMPDLRARGAAIHRWPIRKT